MTSRHFPLKGFSLLETLITIAIIAILAVLLIPNVNKMKISAETAICASNLKQWGNGITLYAGDHNGIAPPGSDHIVTPERKYYSDIGGNRGPGGWCYEYIENTWPKNLKIAYCPADKTPIGIRYIYYMIYLENSNIFVEYTNGSPNSRYIHLAEGRKKILMIDAVDMTEAASLPGDPSAYKASEVGTGAGLNRYHVDAISTRHNGGSNCLFGDGSVRWMSKADASDPRYLELDVQ